MTEVSYQNLFPRNGNFELIKSIVDNVQFNSVIDVGLGEGGASLYFAENYKLVTSLGIFTDGINLDEKILNHENITIVNSSFENFISSKIYDAILMSHVLEHTQNVGLFLKKAYDLLDENGYLFIMVPPYKEYIVGGHLSSGWNMGQLMYNLLLSKFDIKNGHFIEYGHNICAVVKKSEMSLPALKMDNGDINTTKNFWPMDVEENFHGDIKILNWFKDFVFKEEFLPLEKVYKYDTLKNFYSFLFSLDKTKQYILYGFDEVGKLILPFLKKNIKAIVEKDIDPSQTPFIEDIPVIDLNQIKKTDYVIICPFRYQVSLKLRIKKHTKNIVLVEI